jgi:O-acetylhomoserine/O-acetylserine sulfhydrylase-like pyridoxal-dependent enzyme
MAPTVEQLEKRLTQVERDVTLLKAKSPVSATERGWRNLVGTARDHAVYAEITRLGAEYRRQQTEP